MREKGAVEVNKLKDEEKITLNITKWSQLWHLQKWERLGSFVECFEEVEESIELLARLGWLRSVARHVHFFFHFLIQSQYWSRSQSRFRYQYKIQLQERDAIPQCSMIADGRSMLRDSRIDAPEDGTPIHTLMPRAIQDAWELLADSSKIDAPL